MKHRVLFIEDDFITIECAVTHLELSGHEVHVCEDVADGLTRLRYEAWTIVFLDVMLPPGDQFDLSQTVDGRYTGLRVIERVFADQKYEKARSSKWVIITNWRDEPEVDAVAEARGVEILRKPLSIEQLEEIITA